MHFEIGEINIICTSLDHSLTFYRDVLGFEVAGEEDGAVRLRCNGRYVLLLPFAQREADSSPYCERASFSIDLMVDDLAATAKHFTQHAVRFEKPYVAGAKSIFIRDPDGLIFEVIEKS